MDDDDFQLEDRAWWDLCRERGSRSFPPGALEKRKLVMLRRFAASKAELEPLVAEHIAEPSKPDPRTWVL